MTDLSVGLCGLGNMGSLIAVRLARHFSVLGFDVDPVRSAALANNDGMKSCENLAELALAKVVVLCLPSPAISLDVVSNLAPLLSNDSVIVETSTVNPIDVQALAHVANQYGIGVVDAAIAAGVGQMAAGTAALLVGGDDRDVAQVQSVLEAIAAKIVRLGPLGSGDALKVINNAVAHAVMVVLVEAAAMAASAGVPREKLIELMTGNDAGLTRPLTHRLMERIAQGNYEGGMATEAARKDSTLALALAQSNGVPLFAIQAAHSVYEIATIEGKGRLDYAAIAQLWEEWLGLSLTDPNQQ